MKTLEHYGFYLLVITVISELVLPFVLGSYINGYSQTKMLISSFGQDGMATQWAFKIWEIFDGILFVLAAPAFYARFNSTSHPLALWTAIGLAVFGVGDCIITGLANMDKNEKELGLIGQLHNYASGIGVAGLLIGTFLLIWLFYLERNYSVVWLFSILLFISCFFSFLSSVPRLPNGPILHRGLWQRLNLLFSYLPFFIVAVRNLPVFKHTH